LFDRDITELASLALAEARAKKVMIATTESCTGGLVAAALTSIAGSSDVFERGFVTYSNAAKTELIGVPAALISEYGAVSEPVARAMAEGALLHAKAQLAVSITGIAGPGGGSAEKPVGLVHFACARRSEPTLHIERHYGDQSRDEIRNLSVIDALSLIRARLLRP
jgi:nicotinamide-nucleotide amidase